MQYPKPIVENSRAADQAHVALTARAGEAEAEAEAQLAETREHIADAEAAQHHSTRTQGGGVLGRGVIAGPTVSTTTD